ncbi:unnamed protein product [Toxocara canis]|uniref:Uncharacterized protein n=1 Tax=Toxocara canis TaxID=6265 RepID=A0A3P7EWA1_TOXCA|nr:unnamed protein product [Toxocara canis]
MGPTAKRALMEYARKKPEVEQYVLTNPTVGSTESAPPQDGESVLSQAALDYGGYMKDFSAVQAGLSPVFILDNSPRTYRKCHR